MLPTTPILFVTMVCLGLNNVFQASYSLSVSPFQNKNKLSLESEIHLSDGYNIVLSRRRALERVVLGASCSILLQKPVAAFDNKISDAYDDRPKRRGSQVFQIIYTNFGFSFLTDCLEAFFLLF